MEKNEIVLFESRDGAVTLPVSVRDESVWLTRMQMADLFDVTPQNITIHLKKVYAAGEFGLLGGIRKEERLKPRPD